MIPDVDRADRAEPADIGSPAGSVRLIACVVDNHPVAAFDDMVELRPDR